MPAKVFGPTDSVADTLTQVGTTYSMLPGSWIIYKVVVSKGTVVNATNPNGFILIETVSKSYHFAYGGGCGGATNSDAGPGEPIDMGIPVPGNTNLKVYVLDAVVAKDVTVSVQFATENFGVCGLKRINPATFATLAGGGVTANGDTAADTAESFSVNSKLLRATLQPEREGRVYQIRVCGSGIVDAKAASGLIKIYIPGEAGPYEYAFGNGAAGATLGGVAWADVINIPEGIPVHATSTVDVQVTTAEVMKYPHISLSYW